MFWWFHTPEQKREFEAGLVADLRRTAARYPNDQRLKQLIREIAAQSPRFEKLWESGAPVPHQDFGRHKVIDHPDVGQYHTGLRHPRGRRQRLAHHDLHSRAGHR
jgi:hypothetical protein